MESITLYSSDVTISEKEGHPDSYFAKFIICDFSRNGNGVSIDRDTAESWISTLKNKPLVGKIQMRYDGSYDFTGHNVKKVVKTDSNGEKYETIEFDTSAFGSFTDVAIENIDGTDYITAECEIWKRFTKACEIILSRVNDSTLHTSWEINVEKSQKKIVNGLMTKVIEAGRFIGHCLLAKDIQPAYDCSGLVEIASTNYEDVGLSNALSHDLVSCGLDINTDVKEDNMGKVKNDEVKENEDSTIISENSSENQESIGEDKKEDSEETKEISTDESESSSLTTWDLRNKIGEECRKVYRWFWISFMFPVEGYVLGKTDDEGENELDYVKFTYVVNDDGTVSVGKPEMVSLVVNVSQINSEISSKNEAIVSANSEIQRLTAENEKLLSYKERCEKEDADKEASELSEKREKLKEYALSSKQITKAELETDEFKTIISELDEAKLKSIVADRVVASLTNGKSVKVETSEIETIPMPKANIAEVEEVLDYKDAIKSFLSK